MAGGMRIMSPGSSWSVPVMEPRVAPARRSPSDEIMRATSPRVKTDLLREKNDLIPSNYQLTLHKEANPAYINFFN
jgi:hypothetical protein